MYLNLLPCISLCMPKFRATSFRNLSNQEKKLSYTTANMAFTGDPILLGTKIDSNWLVYEIGCAKLKMNVQVHVTDWFKAAEFNPGNFSCISSPSQSALILLYLQDITSISKRKISLKIFILRCIYIHIYIYSIGVDVEVPSV